MKKLLLLFFSFHFSLFTLKAQGTWTQVVSFPDTSRGYGVGFTIDSMCYVGLGYNLDSAEGYNDFWQYNPRTNTWIQKANFPGRGVTCPAVFVIGQRAFVVTGTRDPTARFDYNENWEYNAWNDTWVQKSDFPGISRSCAVGFAIGNRGFIATGCDSTIIALNDIWEYDTATDLWTQKNNFPGTGRFGANGFSVSGKGYICLGTTSHVGIMLGDIWQYDTGTDSWIQMSNFSGTARYLAAGFVINSNIYVGTGQDISATCYQDFWQYNTTTNTWTEEANFPSRVRCVASAFAIGDSGYLGIGNDVDTGFFNDIYVFIPDSSSTSGAKTILSPASSLSIFPNPAISTLNIYLYNIDNGIANINIYDITGRIVQNSQFPIHNFQFSIQISSLACGMYFLHIIANNKQFIQKFTKQ